MSDNLLIPVEDFNALNAALVEAKEALARAEFWAGIRKSAALIEGKPAWMSAGVADHSAPPASAPETVDDVLEEMRDRPGSSRDWADRIEAALLRQKP